MYVYTYHHISLYARLDNKFISIVSEIDHPSPKYINGDRPLFPASVSNFYVIGPRLLERSINMYV